MKTFKSLAILFLVAGVGLWAGCRGNDGRQSSQAQALGASDAGSAVSVSKEEYLKTIESRLDQIEKNEAGFQKKAASMHGKERSVFEQKLGEMVEKRVQVKEKVQELRGDDNRTLSDAKSELESVTTDLERMYKQVGSYGGTDKK